MYQTSKRTSLTRSGITGIYRLYVHICTGTEPVLIILSYKICNHNMTTHSMSLLSPLYTNFEKKIKVSSLVLTPRCKKEKWQRL